MKNYRYEVRRVLTGHEKPPIVIRNFISNHYSEKAAIAAGKMQTRAGLNVIVYDTREAKVIYQSEGLKLD